VARPHTDERSELDWVAMLCLAPSLLYVFAMFIYPFMYGVYVSLQPLKGEAWSIKNYVAFFSDPYQLATIKTTFLLALPTTVVVVLVSLFVAYGMRRGIWMERTITTILVLPISLQRLAQSDAAWGRAHSRAA
jgi:putative spermidine/putrescine transport system permease protein